MDKKMLEIIVCPVTKGPLTYDKKNRELISKSARLAYPVDIHKGKSIPRLNEADARELTPEEIEKLAKKTRK